MISFVGMVVSSVVAYGLIAGVKRALDRRRRDGEKPATKQDLQDLEEKLRQDRD